MTTVRYARVRSTITDHDNSDDNGNQLQTIDSEDEEDILPKVKISPLNNDVNHITMKHSTQRSNSIMRTIMLTGLLILCYFILSIGLTFYQRWLLKGYKFPFSVVIYHLFIKLVMSTLIRIFYRMFTGKQRVKLSVSTGIRKVAPTSFFGAVDIGFSQWGLEFVDVALYTMTKSTVIIFISFFAILFRLEKKSWSLGVIVVMISAGLFLFTYKSTEFDLHGFILLLIASFSSGARWTLAQMLMQKSKLGLHNPIDMIYYMQPYMLLALLPFAVVFESGRLMSHFNQFLELEYYEVLILWTKISIGAFLAFFMEISEFLVLSHTSSLTLSVSGIFKEICQLVLAVEINGEVLSLYNLFGLILCLGGITCHVIYKYWMLTDNTPERVQVDSECHYDMNNQYSTKFDAKTLNETKASTNNGTSVVIAYNAGGQKVPLLDYDSDTNGDDDDMDSKSAEVLFDILKKRDETRN
ncbi:CLUMA_CG016413, isoform A [Clunio marinus]|uniref:CLUMA_CG016413, isoform A n=1 Tax=Clunio marinus TaxID=568069 RepID=A0A1J1ISQ4_9DIPT|nr:CLUMA_CG016413, isoform A [Clunio marinus]